jgi:hypothetical protein
MKTYGEWRYSSTILDLGTSWRWVVSFTPRPLFPRGNRSRYVFDKSLSGRQSWYGRRGEEKICYPCKESNLDSSTVQPVALRYADWANLFSLGFKSKVLVRRARPNWFIFIIIMVLRAAVVSVHKMSLHSFVQRKRRKAQALFIIPWTSRSR